MTTGELERVTVTPIPDAERALTKLVDSMVEMSAVVYAGSTAPMTMWTRTLVSEALETTTVSEDTMRLPAIAYFRATMTAPETAS